MSKTSGDPRIDAYIAAAAPFAQPILRDWRALVRRCCPEVEEDIKWGMPHFIFRGKILSRMAAFKAHCSIGFWFGEVVNGGEDSKDGSRSAGRDGMGDLGKLRSAADLPPQAEQEAMLTRAMALIESGSTPAWLLARSKAPKPLPEMPAELATALQANAAAQAGYVGLAPGQQREYLGWIIEAKRAETRARRVTQAIEWLSEGKTRNWKYANC